MRKSRLSLNALLLLLAGCASQWEAPVGEVAGGARYIDSGRTHQVRAGETLYSIAFMYGLDYTEVATANEISAPYTIYPGQQLLVDSRAVEQRAARSRTQTRSPSTPQRDTQVVAGRDTHSSAGTEAGRDTHSSAAAAAPSASQARGSAPPRTRAAGSAGNGPIEWGWPADGRVIKSFSAAAEGSKGIDITGREGDPVRAAAAGEVVYAGRGLLRYGDMVIIKHNDRYLSAYAHNSRLLVEEGEWVSRGQRIAELGSTGIEREMLHFEIRLDGEPVDPQRHLPPR